MSGTAVASVDDTRAGLAAMFSGGSLSDPAQGSPAPSDDTNYGQLSGYETGEPAAQNTDQFAQPQGAQVGNQQPAMVPSFRLRETTDRLRAAEAQGVEMLTVINQQRDMLAELTGQMRAFQQLMTQPQQQAQVPVSQVPKHAPMPELMNDPQAFAGTLINQVQVASQHAAQSVTEQMLQGERAQLQQLKVETSDMIAEARYGREMVRAATHAAKAAGLMPSMMAKPNPVIAAVQWYQGMATQQRYGADPATVRQNVLAEILQSPEAIQQIIAAARGQPTTGAPAANSPLPPSLSGAPRGAVAFPATPQGSTLDAIRGHFTAQSQKMRGMQPAA